MRLLRQIFVLLALAGYVAVSDAQVVPGRPVQPVPPSRPPGWHAPHGGEGLGSGDGDFAFLFSILFLVLLFGLPVLIVRTLIWLRKRRQEREWESRRCEGEKREQERQERIRADDLRWNSIEERVQALLATHYPMQGRAGIDRVKRELRYSRREITSALIPLGPFRAASITVLVHFLGEPKKGERVELLYSGKQISSVEIPDVELTLWHIRRRSGRQDGPITAAQLREILREITPSPGVRVPRGMRIEIIRSNRDHKWRAWEDAGREYPELVLAGVVQGEK